MSENVNIGDTLIVTTGYGRFKGEVYKLNKMANDDFSLKMIKVFDVEKVRGSVGWFLDSLKGSFSLKNR